MKRNRAPGGGRKPKGEFSQLSSTLTIRIPEDMRKQLEDEAAAKGESMAQRLLWHLRQSFNRQQDKDRDPALYALLYLIGNLAENLSLEGPASEFRTYWRTDWYAFLAFKHAALMLLDALEEPPKPSPHDHKRFKEMCEHAAEMGDYSPEYAKARYSPMALGTREFDLLRDKTLGTDALSETEREYIRLFPQRERELYTLPKAWKALELPEPKTPKAKDKSP
jgi:hypothetical protein